MPDENGLQNENYLEHQILWKDLNPYKFFTYNIVCTFALDVPFYPIDVIRTRMQVQGSSLQSQSFPKYHNTWDAFKKLIRHEGHKGLFQGFLTNELGYATSHVVYFGAYEAAKQNLRPVFSGFEPGFNVFLTTSLAGAIAELTSCVMWVPFDVATQRLQIQGPLRPRTYRNGYELMRQIYNTEGIRGLYRGFGATIIRNMPSSGIWWSTYEVAKNYLHSFDVRKTLHLPPRKAHMLTAKHEIDGNHVQEERKVEDEDPVIHCISGVTAAAVATTLTNPLDVAKTRLQTATSTASARAPPPAPPTPPPLPPPLPKVSRTPPPHTPPPETTKHPPPATNRGHNIFSILALTIKQEGFRALGKGLVPALLISTPYSVLSIVIYEQVKKWSVLG